MKKKSCFISLFCLVLFSTFAFANIETITSTVKQPFGGSQSPDDARIAAIAKAKREALEIAGTYLESLTIIKNNVLEKDEIIALAAGVLKVKVVSQKNYVTEDAFGIIIVAKVDVDTSTLEKRVKALLEDQKLLKKYKESKNREKDLLAKIEELEKQNKKLKSSSSQEKRKKIKSQFRKIARELTATELNGRALALWGYGYYTDVSKAIALLKQAIQIDPEYSEAYNNLGLAYRSNGDYDRAIEYYQKALKIDLKQLGPDHPNVATRYNNLGVAFDNKGDHDRAIEYYQKSLKIGMKQLGPDHPDVAIGYNNIGLVYKRKGDYDRAIKYYKKALKIDLKQLGSNHPRVAIKYNNLGRAYAGNGDYDRAIKYYRKALKIDLKQLGHDHPNVAIRYGNLGSAYQRKGNYNIALEYYNKALKIGQKSLGKNHHDTKHYQRKVDSIEALDPFGRHKWSSPQP